MPSDIWQYSDWSENCSTAICKLIGQLDNCCKILMYHKHRVVKFIILLMWTECWFCIILYIWPHSSQKKLKVGMCRGKKFQSTIINQSQMWSKASFSSLVFFSYITFETNSTKFNENDFVVRLKYHNLHLKHK